MEKAESDRAIIDRVLRGDSQAYGVLYDRYSRYVAAVVSKLVPDHAVDELVLESFVSGYRYLSSFTGTGELRHWFSTIARRRCCDYWRKEQTRKELPVSSLGSGDREWAELILNNEAGAAYTEQEQQAHAKELVNWALAKLSAEDRLVVTLIHLEGIGQTEAAETLGWSIPKTKMRLFRAKRVLQKNLARLLAESGGKR